MFPNVPAPSPGAAAAIALVAILADVLAPHSPVEQYRDALLAPPAWAAGGSWRHPLGTDDIVARLRDMTRLFER